MGKGFIGKVGRWWRELAEREPHTSDMVGRTVFVSRFDDSDLDGDFVSFWGKVETVWMYGVYVFIGLEGECVWLRLEEVEALRLLREGKLSKRFGDIRYLYRLERE